MPTSVLRLRGNALRSDSTGVEQDARHTASFRDRHQTHRPVRTREELPENICKRPSDGVGVLQTGLRPGCGMMVHAVTVRMRCKSHLVSWSEIVYK